MIILLILICIITYIVILWTKKTSRINKLIANIPRVQSLPVIGCALTFNVHPHEFMNLIDSVKKELGTIFCARIGPETVIVLSSVEHCEEVLASSKTTEKAFVYKFLASWVGSGLVTAPADTWRKNRKLITPTFHNKILEDFIEIFNSNSTILVDVLKDKVGEPGFNVYSYINLCALDIIFETSLGLEINVQKSESSTGQRSPIVILIHEFLTTFMYRLCRPWLYPDIFFRLSPTGRKDLKNRKAWNNIIEEVIMSRRERRLKEQKLGNDFDKSEVPGIKRRAAFLDLLLDYKDSGADWTDYELQSEVSTMLIAGHDTVTSAISFALYALRDKPDIQEKILDELNEIFGDSDRDPTFNDLHNMKYLEKVIKESLRVYSTVPYVARYITEDFKLKTGHVLPKGTTAFIILKHLHYDPEIYPEPEVFNPERFNIENSKGRNIYSYSPFSAGPRSCIGQKYGILEMKCVLSKIIRNYKILPAVGLPDVYLITDIILRSKTGVNIQLVKR